jgi:hypothetical protein
LPEREDPIATITLTVGKEAQDELIARLKEFAEAAAFATRVNRYGDNKQHYLVKFWRADVNVTVANPFNGVRYFSVFIYRTGQTRIREPHLDALVSDIKGVINEVRGAIIDSVKKSNE